jgi:hypothetical protein
VDRRCSHWAVSQLDHSIRAAVRRVCSSVAALIMLGMQTACAQTARPPLTPEVQAQWVRDSAAYEARLGKFLRDSTRIDSIAGTVNTDSLYRLFHIMLTTKDPSGVFQAIYCEQINLLARFGRLAGHLAIGRMEDSVYGPIGRDAAFSRMTMRLPENGVSQCGQWHGARAPDSLGTTSLDYPSRRPLPPRRPRG